MSKTKVLLVCQWYQPEPVSQPGWIVDALRSEDLSMEVLTGIPNYPTGEVIGTYRPWKPMTERIDGVHVRRAPLYPSHDQSTFKRLLNYLSWAVAASIFGLRSLHRADVSLVYSSPATAAFPAMIGRALFRTPYVLLIQDVWPDSISASGFLGGRVRRIVESVVDVFVSASYRRAVHIAVTSPGMADLLRSRGVPAEKLSVVYNWVNDVDLVPAADVKSTGLRSSLGISEADFLVMYAGNHGPAQALSCAVEAFAAMPDSPLHLVLIGDGIDKPELAASAQRYGTDRVHFVDPVPRAQMATLMAQADAQLVSLADRPLFAVTTPSKLQSVMAAGRPVLVSANGDAAAVVRTSCAGMAVPAGDVAGLRRAAVQMADLDRADLIQMGENGRRVYDETMSAAVGGRRLASLLRVATTTRRKSST